MSWKIVTLGEIIDLQNGYSFKGSEYTDSGYFLMRITNVQQGFIRNKNPKYVNIPHSSKLKKFILNEGDILMSLTGDVGRVGELKDTNLPAVLNQRVARVIIKSNLKIDKNYLFNLLNSDNLRHQIESKGHGAAQLNVSTNDILSIKISLPPLQIQQKIVEKLNAIFAEVDKASASAEANIKNAEALFQSYLTGFFDEIKKNCKIKLLSEICDVRDGTHDSPKYVMEGIPFITQKNIRKNGLNLKDTKYISIKDHHNFYKRSNVAFGDILISMIGANRGMSAIVNESTLFSIKNVCLVKKSDKIDQNYLLYFFKSRQAQNYIKLFSKGGAQEFIGLTALRKFPIPVPSREIQVKVIEKLNIISTLSETTKEGYNKKFNYLTKLKQSILKQAFNGELVKAA